MIDATLATNVTTLANRYAAAPSQLDDLTARRLDTLTEGPTLNTARATAPVLTGALRDSLAAQGAQIIARGTLESQVTAGVPYADDVVASQPRGRRDYPYATELATAPDRQATADALAADIVDILEGPL